MLDIVELWCLDTRLELTLSEFVEAYVAEQEAVRKQWEDAYRD